VTFSSAVDAMVRGAALEFKLAYPLLAAQVLQESAGNPDASRFEEKYRWTWPARTGPFFIQTINPIAPCSRATELKNQMTSWGLLQIMGANARAYGYANPFLNALTREPLEALRFGCLYLVRMIEKTDSIEEALSAFNAGTVTKSNFQDYVAPILARAERIRSEEPGAIA